MAAPELAPANPLWLPRGHHWDLHIEHDTRGGNAGAFTGGGWGLVWHITVSRWESVDAMVDVLHAKGAEPHFVIGGRAGTQHPVVVQLIPLDRAGRSMQHTLAPQTNRANKVQVEICAEPGAMRTGEPDGRGLFALPTLDAARLKDDDGLCMRDEQTGRFRDGVASWGDDTYRALANLAALVEHRVPIERKVPRLFSNTRRFTADGFVRVKGHYGHMHAPGNTHVDPTTAFDGGRLMRFMGSAPNGL